MSKAAVLVLADTESHADLGRVVNALIATKEFKEAGDDVRLIFDGAFPSAVAVAVLVGPARAGSMVAPEVRSHGADDVGPDRGAVGGVGSHHLLRD